MVDGSVYGLAYIKPECLNEIDDLLVIIYITDTEPIKRQLESMGITNCIDIAEIYELFYRIDL